MAGQIRVRVTGQEKGYYRISDGRQERLAEISGKYRYQVKTLSDYPAVGDYAIADWPEDGSVCTIESIFPRKSAFVRRAAGGDAREQVVAANIDTVFLCMSANRDFSLRRLERYLAAAWDSGAHPVVVITKSELADDLQSLTAAAASCAPGTEVLTVSSALGDLSAVEPYLEPGRTIAFLGSSGVGKSTLINKLLGRDQLQTAAIGNDDEGRHTTTSRQLLTLPGGAFVIDTPGMRELGLWDSEDGLDTAFADIEDLASQCRFSDCTHSGEPGCAVAAALRDGRLPQARWQSYLKLKTENSYTEDREDYLEEKRRKFTQISKANKARRKQ